MDKKELWKVMKEPTEHNCYNCKHVIHVTPASHNHFEDTDCEIASSSHGCKWDWEFNE